MLPPPIYICLQSVSDWCLMPNQQFFSYIVARTSYILKRCFVLDHHAQLGFQRASLLKQQFMGRQVVLLGHILLNLNQPGLCSYSLMLLAQRRNSKSLVYPGRELNPRFTALEASMLFIHLYNNFNSQTFCIKVLYIYCFLQFSDCQVNTTYIYQTLCRKLLLFYSFLFMYILQVKQYLAIFLQENSSLSVQVFWKSYIAIYRHKASNLTVGNLFSFVAFCSSSYYKTKVSCEFSFREVFFSSIVLCLSSSYNKNISYLFFLERSFSHSLLFVHLQVIR